MDFIEINLLRSLFSGKKYPGIHSIVKPNGILQIIFHVGIFMLFMRSILKAALIVMVANKNKDTITESTRIIVVVVMFVPVCKFNRNHV